MLYPIAIEKEIYDGKPVYGVIVPDVLGCITVGDTIEEAYENIREALMFHLEGLAEDGDEIPIATSIEKHINNSDYEGMSWAMADIDVSKYLGKTEKFNITLPTRLVHLIDTKVLNDKARYKSRSGYLASLAERDLMVR